MRHPLEPEPTTTQIVPLGSARLQRISVVVLVGVAFLAAAWIASALWAGLLLGVLVAFALEPLHRRLLARFPGHRAATAGFCVFAVAALAAAFLFGLAFLVAREAASALASLRATMGAPGAPLTGRFAGTLESLGVPPVVVGERIGRITEQLTDVVSRGVSFVLGSTFATLGGTLIALVTAFYTLRDRRPIERRLEQVLPLHPRTTRELVEEFRLVGRGTLIGSTIAGLVQGVFATVGFAIAGVHRALLLGALTAVSSLVPIFGTMIVWVPAGVVLIASGHVTAGIFELFWGAIVVSMLVDYVVRPALVGSETRSHPLLFLIGLIGGVEVLGAIGIVAGPIVMALFAAVLRIYRREVVEPARQQSPSCERDEPQPRREGAGIEARSVEKASNA